MIPSEGSRRGFLRAIAAVSVGPAAGRSGERRTRVDGGTVADWERAGGNTQVLGFTGDVMLGRSVDERHRDTPPGAVWGDLLPRLRALDGLFVNLECCVSDRGDPWPDRTYHFRADPEWVVPSLAEVGVTWASLANNHVMDFGEEALVDTRRHLSSAGVRHSGAGRDVEEATRPAHVSIGDVDVGVVSFTDNAPEYAASADRAGTAYVDVETGGGEHPTVRRAMERARELEPDLLVASIHWGPNWVLEPDVRYRRFAHRLVEEGVDLVHGHSAHVFQGIEVYRGNPILHDTGDFVDDYRVLEGFHNDRSFLFTVEVGGDGMEELRMFPVQIRDETVRRGSETAGAWARSRMRRRSRAFGTELRSDGNELVVAL